MAGEGGVSPNGRLLTGKQHRVTLGNWPAIGLVAARERARELLGSVTEGRDPRTELREANLLRVSNTVEAVTRRFIEQDAQRTVATWKKIERCMELHVLPELGDRPIQEVRRAEIHELLDDLVGQGRVGTAREVRKHLSRLFNWALDREIIADNPVNGMVRNDLVANGEAGRALSDDEIRALWNAALVMGYPFGPFYRLLLLTGQRRGEWARARRSEIDGDRHLLEIPSARYKSGRDHVVPLSDPVREIVDALPEWSGNDYYILSSRAGRVPISGFSKAKRRLDELAGGLSPWRAHDLRVTCESRLADLGFVQEVRDAVLGHAKPGLQRTYNKHDYMNEKREALAAYAEHLLEVTQ